MAGLKEPGTAGTSGCVVMFVHILVVGRQALVNHISILRFLSHVFFKASTSSFLYVPRAISWIPGGLKNPF